MQNIMSHIPGSTTGSIILTSRCKDVEVPGSLRIPVKPLDLDSSIRLLDFVVSCQEDRDSAKQVWEQLGGLPLAIVTAGKCIKIAQISPAEYLQLFNGRVAREFSIGQDLTTWQYGRTMQTVLDDSLVSLSSDARDLLNCMAFLNPDTIPEELFLQTRKSTVLPYLELSIPE